MKDKPHYHLMIGVTKDEVEIIKKEFDSFMDKAGGLTLNFDTDEVISKELHHTIKMLFIQLLVMIKDGKFTGIN